MNSLVALEENVARSGLSGRDITVPGDTSIFATQPTIAIGPAFGTQLTRQGLVSVPVQNRSVPSASSYAPSMPSVSPSYGTPAAPAYQPSPSGPDWTPQPGMLYAAGQAYTPQDYINRFGYATYLSVAGGGAASAAAPSSAPAAALPPAPTSAPSGAPVSISPVGLPMPAQTAGQGVSVSAPTLDFSSYFGGGTKPTKPKLPPAHEPIAHRPQRPLRGLGEDDLREGIVFHLVLLAGLLWYIGHAYRIKK